MQTKDLSNSFNPYPKNKEIKEKKKTQIKKRSKKQNQLEKERNKNIKKAESVNSVKKRAKGWISTKYMVDPTEKEVFKTTL